MRKIRLESTDGFVLVDLDGAERAAGIVRSAPKILQDGAMWLARSATYQWASFGHAVSGASAGLNASPDDRPAAVAAFVEEIRPLVADGTFLPSAGKGVTADDLAPLREVDGRGDIVPARIPELTAHTVAASVASVAPAAGAMRVVLEGLDLPTLDGAGLLRRLVGAGATVVGVSTAAGAVASSAGLDPAAIEAALGGEALPGEPLEGVAALCALDADVVVAGSKAGVIDHAVAGSIAARAVVPCGPIPVTAKALAVLRRAGVAVLADFVTTAGPVFGAWPPQGATIESVEAEAATAVRAVLDEVATHGDGPLVGAAKRAEAFLATWNDELPFGRPIA